jgi:hypothetical protein
VPGLVSHQTFVKEKLEVVSQEFASMEQLMMVMQLEVASQEFASMESLMDIQLNLCPNPLAIIVESGGHEDKKDKGRKTLKGGVQVVLTKYLRKFHPRHAHSCTDVINCDFVLVLSFIAGSACLLAHKTSQEILKDCLAL